MITIYCEGWGPEDDRHRPPGKPVRRSIVSRLYYDTVATTSEGAVMEGVHPQGGQWWEAVAASRESREAAARARDVPHPTLRQMLDRKPRGDQRAALQESWRNPGLRAAVATGLTTPRHWYFRCEVCGRPVEIRRPIALSRFTSVLDDLAAAGHDSISLPRLAALVG